MALGYVNPSSGRPDPAIPWMPPEKRTIVSVMPRTAFNKVEKFGHFEIDPCPKCDKHGRAPCERCRPYAKLVVGAVRDPIDDPMVPDGSGRRFDVYPAQFVAESCVTEGCLDRGVFIAKGAEPTDSEIDAANAAYRKWAETLVSEADGVWGQKRDAAWINPHAHDAAKFLGVKREWDSDTTKVTDCASCGELVRKGAIICGKCGHPVEWQKAYEMGLLNDKQEQYGLKNSLIAVASAEPEPEAYAAPVRDTNSEKYQKQLAAIARAREAGKRKREEAAKVLQQDTEDTTS